MDVASAARKLDEGASLVQIYTGPSTVQHLYEHGQRSMHVDFSILSSSHGDGARGLEPPRPTDKALNAWRVTNSAT